MPWVADVWKEPKQRTVPRGLWGQEWWCLGCVQVKGRGEWERCLMSWFRAGGERLDLCCVSALFLVKLKVGGLCPWHLSSPQLSCALCGCASMAQLYSAFLD